MTRNSCQSDLTVVSVFFDKEKVRKKVSPDGRSSVMSLRENQRLACVAEVKSMDKEYPNG